MPNKGKNSKSKNNKLTGTFGEEIVTRFLTQRGYEIIEKNWRVREGCHRLIGERAAEIVTSVPDAMEFVSSFQ
jgi:predicted CoA-binding protein